MTWDGRAVATLALGTALDPGRYRLIACGDGASFLRDRAGNPLDGDGDLAAGGDYLIDFRADPDNQLADGHFDCDLGVWTLDSMSAAEISFSEDDVMGSPDSGSAVRRDRTSVRAALAGAMLCLLLTPGVEALPDDVTWRELQAPPAPASPALPSLNELPQQLVLDDGSAEGTVGVGAVTARQFLWFQRFSSGPSAFELEEIWVLFPQDPQIVPGAAVQLVVYSDHDGNPATGADLMLAFDEVVQVADGAFSVYPLPSPLLLPGGDVLIGVVNRYVVSGVSPPSQPAAEDTSSSAGRAWLATWTGDPPDPPVFPPDESLFRIDDLIPGNWMIRGFGVSPSPVEVPTLDRSGAAVLALLLLLAATRQLGGRRVRKASKP